MSSGTSIKKGRAAVASARRLERMEARAQRQQLRAMEARAAKTGPAVVEQPNPETELVEVTATGAAPWRREGQTTRSVALSRTQEYAYIRSDMRRLTVIAAGLLIVIFALIPILG